MERILTSSFVREVSFRSSLILIALATAFQFSGCGIAPEGDDSEAAQRQRQNDKLERAYSSIQGLYRGSLRIKAAVAQDADDAAKNQYRELAGSLLLYVTTAQEGFDRTGAPIFHPRLFAQLKFDGVGELDDTTFLVDYRELTGDVEFKQPQAASSGGSASSPIPVGSVTSCPVGPRDNQLAMRGKILGGAFTEGRVYGTNGNLGSITMKLESSSGDLQPIRDQRERLERAYAKVMGTWEGKSGISVGKNIVSADSSIIVYTDEITVAEGVNCPQLRARFRLEDIVGRLDDTFMNASYREGTGELFLTATAPPADRKACSMGPQDLKLAVVASVDQKQMRGLLKGSTGNQGKISMAHVSDNPVAPDDQRERQEAAFSKVTGTYGGMFIANSRGNFPVRVDLSVTDDTEDEYLSCKKLQANYTRPDLVSGAGTIQTQVDYAMVSQRITIHHAAKSTTGIPGHDFLSISGQLTLEGSQAKIAGSMQVWDRVGKVSLVRCGSRQTVGRSGKCEASRSSRASY